MECTCVVSTAWTDHAEHCAVYIVKQKNKRIAELETDLADEKNLNGQMYAAEAHLQSEICDLKGLVSRIESALREIAEHPRCKPECKGAYNQGLTEGHRCCAEIARRALKST